MEKELLTTCGLNSTEQQILLFLLEYGRNGVSTISKRTGIKRPTAYSALSNLEQMGLIGRHIVRKSTHFSAIDPELIPNVFIGRAKSRFEEITQAAFQLESELKEFKLEKRQRLAGYEISTIESGSAMYAFLETVLVKGGYRGMFNPQTAFATQQGKDVGLRCLRETGKTKPHIREIAVAGPQCKWWKGNIKNPNHLVKEVKINKSLRTDVLLFDDTVMLTNYNPDGEMAVLIKHVDYFEFMVATFDAFWKSLKDTSKKGVTPKSSEKAVS